MLDNMLWSITPGGLLSVVLIALVLAGCAPLSPRGDAASFEASTCKLGVAHADQVMSREVFRDPVDALITAAIDAPKGTWQC